MFNITQAILPPTRAVITATDMRGVAASDTINATAAVITTAAVTEIYPYTPCRMTANAVGALSQAHTENRVPASEPGGAIFICGVS